MPDGEPDEVLVDHGDRVTCLSWSRDGTWLASGSRNGDIWIWNATLSEPRVLARHRRTVTSLSFSFDGLLLASKSADGSIVLWRLDQLQMAIVLYEPATSFADVGLAFHPAASILAAASELDTAARIWDLNVSTILSDTSVPPPSTGSEDWGPSTRFLVGQVPGAGGRWRQLHLNEAVVIDFFRIRPHSEERVILRERRADRSYGPTEVRRCVYSEHNKNYKIEVGARRGMDYPTSGVPIVIFREHLERRFDYMLLFPDEAGHAELLALTQRLPKHGKGFPRAITTASAVKSAWPECPLLSAGEP
jgi:hypothetical protein